MNLASGFERLVLSQCCGHLTWKSDEKKLKTEVDNAPDEFVSEYSAPGIIQISIFFRISIGQTRWSFRYFWLLSQPRSHSLPPFNVLFSAKNVSSYIDFWL